MVIQYLHPEDNLILSASMAGKQCHRGSDNYYYCTEFVVSTQDSRNRTEGMHDMFLRHHSHRVLEEQQHFLELATGTFWCILNGNHGSDGTAPLY